jgi:hypothetical protein
MLLTFLRKRLIREQKKGEKISGDPPFIKVEVVVTLVMVVVAFSVKV